MMQTHPFHVVCAHAYTNTFDMHVYVHKRRYIHTYMDTASTFSQQAVQ